MIIIHAKTHAAQDAARNDRAEKSMALVLVIGPEPPLSFPEGELFGDRKMTKRASRVVNISIVPSDNFPLSAASFGHFGNLCAIESAAIRLTSAYSSARSTVKTISIWGQAGVQKPKPKIITFRIHPTKGLRASSSCCPKNGENKKTFSFVESEIENPSVRVH